MKKLATLIFALFLAASAMAGNVHYFNGAQASRVVTFLNAQQEVVIYCGYPDELETYVLLNDVWTERVNSAFYEIWIYGYDAYTGEEIFMPIDLDCIWLVRNGHLYSAAQSLRFRCTVAIPNISWSFPVYNTYVRVAHPAHYVRSYHYNVHCYGWVPPTPAHNPYHMHAYYMRTPTMALPVVQHVYTPGREKPVIVQQYVQDSKGKPTQQVVSRPSPRTSSASPVGEGNANRRGSNANSQVQSSRSVSSQPVQSSRQQNTTTQRQVNTQPVQSSSSRSNASQPVQSSRQQSTTTQRQVSTQPVQSSRSAAPANNNSSATRSNASQPTQSSRGTATATSSSNQSTQSSRNSATPATRSQTSEAQRSSQMSPKSGNTTTTSGRSTRDASRVNNQIQRGNNSSSSSRHGSGNSNSSSSSSRRSH